MKELDELWRPGLKRFVLSPEKMFTFLFETRNLHRHVSGPFPGIWLYRGTEVCLDELSGFCRNCGAPNEPVKCSYCHSPSEYVRIE